MKKVWLVLVFTTLVACGETAELRQPELPDKAEPAVDPAQATVPPFLPAYEAPWEKKIPGKADAYDDFRKLHPQWYAITKPPQGNIRPMQEWEPMQALLMTFSANLMGTSGTTQTIIDTAVETLNSGAGQVWIVADGNSPKNSFKNKLKANGISSETIAEQVVFFDIENDAFWFIDYGPFPLINTDSQTMAFGDWIYYHQRILDDAIPTRLGNQLGINTYRSPFPFEGGNFQADGVQFCYYGERTFYYSGLSQAQVEKINADYFGCQDSVVLKEITNDGTGHIDMFFKLAGKHTAIVGDYTVVTDATNKKRMDDDAKLLESLVYDDGSPAITVYRLPMPHASQGTPRTFINSTLMVSADESVKINLWPMYTVDKDLEAEAVQVWEESMPDWQHIGIISDEISLLSGAVHCVTRTIPALPFEKWAPDGECVDSQCVSDEGSYDGPCIPTFEPDPGCWGPQWECLCNNCNSSSCKIPASCGDDSCDAGENCFNCIQDCPCGAGSSCNLSTGQCDACGNGTCDDTENCTTCPADCGCESGTACSFGLCTQYPCGGVMYQGCCDGKSVAYCNLGQLGVEDCGAQSCGWDGTVYTCGPNGEDPGGDYPKDCHHYDYPVGCGDNQCGDNGAGYSCGECLKGLECEAGVCVKGCEPECENKQCGDDGCDGVCGECGEGQYCSSHSKCEDECTPDCADRTCGDDGCDDSCGECGENEVCAEWNCVSTLDTDIVTEDTTPGQEDLAAEEDVEPFSPDIGATDNDKGDSGSCAHSTSPRPGAALLFFALLCLMFVTRRKETTC